MVWALLAIGEFFDPAGIKPRPPEKSGGRDTGARVKAAHRIQMEPSI